jgi:hypothetical protein
MAGGVLGMFRESPPQVKGLVVRTFPDVVEQTISPFDEVNRNPDGSLSFFSSSSACSSVILRNWI